MSSGRLDNTFCNTPSIYLKREEILRFTFPVSQRKALFMQVDKLITIPLDETQETVSNEPTEAAETMQVASSDEHIPTGKGSEDGTTETVLAPPHVYYQFALPPWPTSQAGPEVTAPSPGQRPVPTRTDQVTYDFYDQERGMPGITPEVLLAQESNGEPTETRQTAPTATQADRQLIDLPPLSKRVTVGQQVYDMQGARVGKVAVRFPLYLLIERGWIFPQVYYVPLSLVAQSKGQSLWLNVLEETLKANDFAMVPLEINDTPAPPVSEDCIDISDVSSLGMSPLTPAETGHYHYGPRGPGINTDASGSYTRAEIDPRGQIRGRPVKLYITGERLHSRNG
jgi:hypothetical protein